MAPFQPDNIPSMQKYSAHCSGPVLFSMNPRVMFPKVTLRKMAPAVLKFDDRDCVIGTEFPFCFVPVHHCVPACQSRAGRRGFFTPTHRGPFTPVCWEDHHLHYVGVGCNRGLPRLAASRPQHIPSVPDILPTSQRVSSLTKKQVIVIL